MKSSKRLDFIRDKTEQQLNELWKNCFEGAENLSHINGHAPYPITIQQQLNTFLTADSYHQSWLIQRNGQKDIIGFIVHGDYLPGKPNNIGFSIGLDYIRNGYASESLNQLLLYLKGNGFSETFGHCYDGNIPSIKTMEACGFKNLGKTGNQFDGHYEVKFKKEL